MGSRYGGLKQMDPIGPHGEFILDYTIRDALAAGFNEIVLVIRSDIEEDFRRIVGDRWEAKGAVLRYVIQSLGDLPEGFSPPEGRTKPWGTGHAVLAAREWLDAPFAVANADDYYGADGFRVLAEYLEATAAEPNAYGMVGYRVDGTLSDFGGVSRGVCKVDETGRLLHIEERLKIAREADGIIRDGDLVIPDDTPVSMNLFGFKPSYATELQVCFKRFLEQRGGELKSEFYLALPLQGMLDENRASMQVLRANARWFGVTNREDRIQAEKELSVVPPVWA